MAECGRDERDMEIVLRLDAHLAPTSDTGHREAQTFFENGYRGLGAAEIEQSLIKGGPGECIEYLDITDHPDLDSLTKVTSIRFRIGEPGNFSDWHQESRRNYIITLSGEGELGLGDGTSRRFGPGQVMLVEDLTGQGHTTRVTSTEPRITIAIPLKNQTPGP